MKANLYATFRLLAGVKTIILELVDEITIQQVVDEIVRKYPALRKQWLNEQGELQSHVHIFLNGNDIQNLPDKISAAVRTEDILDFFPPVSGGCLLESTGNLRI